MQEFVSKPLSDPILDAFTDAADAAMRRAYRVAEKQAARYGLKLVLESPRSPVKRKAVRRRAQGA